MKCSSKEVEVIARAWEGGFTLQSNFYRDNAVTVALCASEGFITTKTSKGGFGNIWRPTPKGLHEVFTKTKHLKE
ncbi:hypothetical protein A7981_05590 [Methylovorus sp. MM2]|uniref:hypothetical protein n=1 Tax=Methylovorus sp. MM2 TaxID=1848038 RepID=UPI0007E160E1|nr:hypothetical protein [Methylovorus sp. MM2]OAM52909.1 hypothetical protein A7981_05590 [Methylovorus sp. MM2]